MENGYIKLYRKIGDWEWSDDYRVGWVWVYILTHANWKDKRWHGIEIKRGQFVTSQDKLAKATGLSRHQVRLCLDKLQTTKEVAILTAKTYTLITVIKYDTYQVLENVNGQVDGQRTANERPLLNKERIDTNTNKDTDNEMKVITSKIYPTWNKVYSFVNHFKHYNREAVLFTLKSYLKQSMLQRIENPWAYCLTALQIQNGNFNERSAIENHESVKNSFSILKLVGEENEA